METASFTAKPIESAHSRVERAIRARHGMKSKKAEAGHAIGYTENPASGEVHVVGSVVSQLSAGLGLEGGVRDEFVRYRKIAGRGRRNILFLVDTSGSMVSAGRLSLVKGCVVSLLEDAYVNRTRVAIIGFGGVKARMILPFTTSAEMAAARIDAAKGGGATPLLDALALAMPLLEGVSDEPAEVVLMSDGGFNRPRGVSAEKILKGFAEFCKKRSIPIYFIDSGAGRRTAQRRAQHLAAMLHADYRPLSDLRADTFA